ncbi:hypothetical protein AURDEDRAFT_174731 [Auricularia subglabra TFB-10046 SS5]|nr:hypothetical protein AURDEDRAFT_174731 [Auricularia subglabra TFB-10046 SS5]
MSISSTPVLLNYVNAAIHLVEAETRMAELFRDEILAAALDFYHPLSICPSRGDLGAPIERFIVETPAEHGYPPVAPGSVSFYDVLHDLELVFQLSEFRDNTFNFAHTFFQHFGVSRAERECQLRVDVPDVPWPVPIRGALTLVHGDWASASTFYGLRVLGLDNDQRWVVQTDGQTYWVRDFAYGLCYEVSVEMLRAGTTLDQIVRQPEFFDRRGEMAIPLVKRFTLGEGGDWQFPYAPGELVETRHAMWRNVAHMARETAKAKRAVSDLWADYDGVPAFRRFHRLDDASSLGEHGDSGDNALGLYREVSTEDSDADSSDDESDAPSSPPGLEEPDWSESRDDAGDEEDDDEESDDEESDAESDSSVEYRPRRPRVYVRTYAASTVTSMAMWSDEGGAGGGSDMEVDSANEREPLLRDRAVERARAWVAVSTRACAYREHRGATERRRARLVRSDEDPVRVGHYSPSGIGSGAGSSSSSDEESDIGEQRELAFAEPSDFDNVDI